MREKRPQISTATKITSGLNYINEVSIDGKITKNLNKIMGNPHLYVAEVMRKGNCLTLLNSKINFSFKSFKNLNLFEENIKYVYWTFNEVYLIQLSDYLNDFSIVELNRLKKLTVENILAYDDSKVLNPDGELFWCFKKNKRLKEDKKFESMFEKDNTNRKAFLKILNNIIKEKENNNIVIGNKSEAKEYDIIADVEILTHEISRILFSDMVKPTEGKIENTIDFIKNALIQAKAKVNIFEEVKKSHKGENPYNLKDVIKAMIDHFYDKKFFVEKYDKDELFNAFLDEYNISIPKSNGKIQSLIIGNHYQDLIRKLKMQRINPLS